MWISSKTSQLKNSSATLVELNIKSGETFTLVNKQKTDRELISPGMKRKEVPADNSCLFYSVFFSIHGHISASDCNEDYQILMCGYPPKPLNLKTVLQLLMS